MHNTRIALITSFLDKQPPGIIQKLNYLMPWEAVSTELSFLTWRDSLLMDNNSRSSLFSSWKIKKKKCMFISGILSNCIRTHCLRLETESILFALTSHPARSKGALIAPDPIPTPSPGWGPSRDQSQYPLPNRPGGSPPPAQPLSTLQPLLPCLLPSLQAPSTHTQWNKSLPPRSKKKKEVNG